MGERLELADRATELHPVLQPLARDRHKVIRGTDEVGSDGDVADHQPSSTACIVDRSDTLQLHASPRLAGERLDRFHITRRPGDPRRIRRQLDEHVSHRGPRKQRW